MKKSDRNALYLGLLICAGIIGMFAVTIFYPKEENKGKQVLRVAFTHIGEANKGTNVCLAGKVIGTVSSIHNIIDQCLVDDQDRLYCYELVLKVDSNVVVYEGDRIVMHSPKLITEPIINIIPSKMRMNTPRLTSLHLAFGDSVDPLNKIMDFIDQTERTINHMHNEISQFIRHISVLLKNEDQVSVVPITLEILSSIQKGADQISLLLDRSEQIDRLLADCGEVAAFMKDYGLLYQHNNRWKRAQKFHDKQKPLLDKK